MHRIQRQIERYRKGTAIIQVQDQDCRPCVGAQISVEQETHQFQFGCLVSDLSAWSSNDQERYHRRVGEVFNVVLRQDHVQQAGAELLTIDLTNRRERMHLAEVRRELDRLNVAAPQGKSAAIEVHAYVSGSTIGSCDYQRGDTMRADEENIAAQRVAGLYTLCFSHPCVHGVYWCGVSDREENAHRGGLLRRDLSPTKAHKILRKLVNVIWHTRVYEHTDTLGRFRFRGFFGTYRVMVSTFNTKPAISQFRLHKRCDNHAIALIVGQEKG